MRGITLLVACAALALAGCGGGGDSSSSNSSSGSSATPAASGNTVTIDMKNIQFAPKDVTVKTGQTVKWVNQDTVDHDVKADSGQFKSDLFGKGQSFEWKADKAGTVSYVCTVHPGMTGKITVQ